MTVVPLHTGTPDFRLPLESTRAGELRETVVPFTLMVPRTNRKMPVRATVVYTPGAPKTPTLVAAIGSV